MRNPLISICIPAYNVARFIGETLESIKNQSYLNWELIVVDDGSDDGTKNIVETFSKNVNQQVRYFKNEINKGPSATRNTAVSFAKGTWYAFLDGDDVWHEDHLKHLIKTALDNPECDVIYSDLIYFFDDVNQPLFDIVKIVSDENLKNFPLSLYQQDFFIQPSTMMVSRKLYSKVGGFDEKYIFAEDFKFNLKCVEEGFKFAYTDQSTCRHRKHPDGFSTNYFKMTHNHAIIFEDTISWNLFGISQKIRFKKAGNYWLSTARMAKKTDLELSKKSIKKAMKYDFNFKTFFHFILISLLHFRQKKHTKIVANN